MILQAIGKAMEAAIAEITGEKPRHLGMPSQAFEIGQYSVSKDGMLYAKKK